MPKPRPRISALSYDGGKPFISGVELIQGQQYTITATVNTLTRSVVWKRDGNTVKIDSGAPFNYTWTPNAIGSHTYVVTPYSGTAAGGNAGPSVTVNWTLKEAAPTLTTALVSWTQITGAEGYRVFWGTVSRQYSYNHDVTSLNYRVPDLVRGKTYYFSAKSFAPGVVSEFGNEVLYIPA